MGGGGGGGAERKIYFMGVPQVYWKRGKGGGGGGERRWWLTKTKDRGTRDGRHLMNLPPACLRFVTAIRYHSTSFPLGENADLVHTLL